jgi:hypothetical protein
MAPFMETKEDGLGEGEMKNMTRGGWYCREERKDFMTICCEE